ncbi:MAG TPA: hypothetical protein DDX71_01915 [Ruminococcus sp.]|nr:hypothetical protein [Ruminococcus sp.]
MKKQFWLLIFLPLVMLLLTACHETPHNEIEINGLPENTVPILLVQEETLDDSVQPPADASANVKYRRDGWAAFAGYVQGAEEHCYGAEHPRPHLWYTVNGSREDLIGFCETHSTVRIAAIDANDGVQALSEPIVLHPEGTLYAARDLEYDWDTGESRIIHGYTCKWHGRTVGEWWFLTATAAQICGLLVFVGIIINDLVNHTKKRRFIEWLLVGLMALPFLAADMFYIAMQRSPRLTWEPHTLNEGDIFVLILSNILWLVLFAGVSGHQYITRNASTPEEERKFT